MNIQNVTAASYNKDNTTTEHFSGLSSKLHCIFTDIVFLQPYSNVFFLYGSTALVDLGLLTAGVSRSHSDTGLGFKSSPYTSSYILPPFY